MNTNLKQEVEFLRSCFKGYDVDQDGLMKIAKIILEKNKEIDANQATIKELEKELSSLRNYCTLTFGTSHPEINKCLHEVLVEELRGALEDLMAEQNGPPLLLHRMSWKKAIDRAKQALKNAGN